LILAEFGPVVAFDWFGLNRQHTNQLKQQGKHDTDTLPVEVGVPTLLMQQQQQQQQQQRLQQLQQQPQQQLQHPQQPVLNDVLFIAGGALLDGEQCT
jgi:hypothetical protein